jgi:hypothetical protein
MLGFCPFASAPFASTGSGAIVNHKAYITGEAFVDANANADWSSNADMIGEAILNTTGTIAGGGWVRQNPNTPEWDMDKSQDWNQIK